MCVLLLSCVLFCCHMLFDALFLLSRVLFCSHNVLFSCHVWYPFLRVCYPLPCVSPHHHFPCVVGVPEGAVGVAPVSPGLKRKLRKRDVLGPGGDNQDPLPVPFHLTKPLLYSPSLQRGGIAVSTSTLSSRSTCSSMTTDSGSDDSRLSQAVTSSQPTDVTDSELESLGGSLRDDSGVTTDDSHDTDGRRQPRYV